MMRSLALKLTLAFLVVGVVGVALVALFVGQRTRDEFDRLVLNRAQQELVDELAAYYQTQGDWEDINAILVQGQPGHMWSRGGVPAPVVLLDDNNTVVYGGRRYRKGTQLEPQDAEDSDRRVPIQLEDQTVGWLLFESFADAVSELRQSPESAFLEQVKQAILWGALGATAVALLIGALLARTISHPVRELIGATRGVARGELGQQVPVRTRDELGELAASFNQMSSDLARSTELRRQMTADIAHELRTPLSLIMGYTEALSDGKFQGSPETFDILHEEAQHLSRLVDDLRTLSLADAGELSLTCRPAAPPALLERAAAAHAAQAQGKAVALRVEADPDLPEIVVDPDRMAQVLDNLVSNALRYTPAGGAIVLSAAHHADTLELRVRDSGAGIPPEELPHIFDRFYRGEKSRYQQNGESGLGLAIAKSIVEIHNGTIEAQSTLGVGTTFIIRLPVHRP